MISILTTWWQSYLEDSLSTLLTEHYMLTTTTHIRLSAASIYSKFYAPKSSLMSENLLSIKLMKERLSPCTRCAFSGKIILTQTAHHKKQMHIKKTVCALKLIVRVFFKLMIEVLALVSYAAQMKGIKFYNLHSSAACQHQSE